MTIETLKMAMADMADPKKKASEVASRLGITTATLYAYVNGDGSVKEPGQHLLDSSVGKYRTSFNLADSGRAPVQNE